MSPRQLLPAALSAAVFLLAAPAIANPAADAPARISEFPPDPFPSTYHPLPSQPTLIRHVTVYTGTGAEVDDADVLMKDGKAIPMVDRQRELRDRYLPYVKPDAPAMPPAYSPTGN